MTENVKTETYLICEDTECELIAALLSDGEALSLCQMERLTPPMFWKVRHEWIYSAMLELNARGDEIDIITVSAELERRGQLVEVQGDDLYLQKLLTFSGFGFAHRTYAANIRRMYEWRRFLQLGGDIATIAQARGDGKSVVTAWSEFQRMLNDARPYEPNQNFTYGLDTFSVWRKQNEDMRENVTTYEPPWKLFQRVYGDAQPGDMFGVVGPTGSGKSSALSTAAEYYAEALGMRTAYIFTEMRLKKVLDRRMAKNSEIDYRRLKNPVEWTGGEKDMLIEAEQQIVSWAHKLDYWHASTPTASGLLATMRRMNTELGTEVFVVDHMNDVDVSEYRADAKNWAMFLVDLEAFCNETGSILWTAAQTNKSDGKAYMIGQAFDHKMCVVMELQPQELKVDFAYTFGDNGKEYHYYAGQQSPVVPIHFRKVRDGSPSRGKLLFVGPRYLWVDVPAGFDDGSDDPGACEEDHVFRGAKD